MIIFGTTSTKKTLSEGEFHCPQCQTKTAYRERRAKQWGHLYWIPIIPMEEYPPFIECRECKGAFVPEILQYDPTADQRFLEDFEQACLLTAAKMACLDGTPGQGVRQMIVELMKSTKSGETPLGAAAVDAAIADMESRDVTMAELVKPVADGLNDRGRELVMMNLAEVALARGKPGPEATVQLKACGEALGLSPAHVRGIIAEFEDRAAGRAVR